MPPSPQPEENSTLSPVGEPAQATPPSGSNAEEAGSESDGADKAGESGTEQDQDEPVQQPTARQLDEHPPLPAEQPPLPPGPAPAAVHQKNDWAAIWSPEYVQVGPSDRG